jgi:hypothetical protein
VTQFERFAPVRPLRLWAAHRGRGDRGSGPSGDVYVIAAQLSNRTAKILPRELVERWPSAGETALGFMT